jgi:hypothetical protein
MADVRRTGFKPAIPWSQTTYSTGLNYFPKRIKTSVSDGFNPPQKEQF